MSGLIGKSFNGWGRSPRWSLRLISNIGGVGAQVLLILEKRTYWGQNNIPRPVSFTIDQLCDLTKKKQSAVRKAIKTLIDAGVITRIQRGGRAGSIAMPSVFRINPTDTDTAVGNDLNQNCTAVPTAEGMAVGNSSQPSEKRGPTSRKTGPNRHTGDALLESNIENISREHAACGKLLLGLEIKLNAKQIETVAASLAAWPETSVDAKCETLIDLWKITGKESTKNASQYFVTIIDRGVTMVADAQRRIDRRQEEAEAVATAQAETIRQQQRQALYDALSDEQRATERLAWLESMGATHRAVLEQLPVGSNAVVEGIKDRLERGTGRQTLGNSVPERASG